MRAKTYRAECHDISEFFYLFFKFTLRKKFTLQKIGEGGAWPGVDGSEKAQFYWYVLINQTKKELNDLWGEMSMHLFAN